MCYCIQLQSFNIGEQFGQRHFLILTLYGKICLKNFLHWLPWSIVTLGGIQDSTYCILSVRRSFGPWADHSQVLILKWAQHSPYELYTRPKSSKRYSLKWSYVHKVWKAVLYQKWLEHNLPKGWDHRRQTFSKAIGYWLTNRQGLCWS
jgi:hypothetical protein